jgi:hypothetical protein
VGSLRVGESISNLKTTVTPLGIKLLFFNYRSTIVGLILLQISAVSIAQNPFEIQKRQAIDQMAIDTSLTSDTIESEVPSQTFNEKNYLQLKAKNPFEVTHIPLPRRKITSIGQIEIKIKPKVSNSFILWIMMFSWALLALVLGNKRDIVPKSFKSIFNENILKLTKRQDGERFNFHFIMVYLVFFINISVFAYLVVKHYSGQGNTLTWFFILLGVIGVYIIRHTTLKLMGWIFPLEKEAGLYSFLIMVINLILGLGLIPVNLMMAFANQQFFQPAMIAGCVLFGLLLLLRYIRGLAIAGNYIFNNIFLFFIYLCVVEIAPTLLGIRLIAERF